MTSLNIGHSRAAAFAACGLLVLAVACRPTSTRSAADVAALAEQAEAQAAWRARVVTDSVRAVLARGLVDSAYPAAYAVIGSATGVYASVGVGSIADSTLGGFMLRDVALENGSHREVTAGEVTDSTLWDLASLTKVIATTSAVMQLVAAHRVELDVPATQYLPRWRAPGAEAITVRELLTHTSGLPAWRPLYKEAWSAEEALAQVYATGPDTTPGVRYLYSDLGFILLGDMVQQLSGLPLDSYVLSRVFLPLDMRETKFQPSSLWASRTAPTELDPWRHRLLRGEVHDENSFRLGSVAGHAGLFSSARDLTRFAQMLLRHGASADSTAAPVLDARTLAAFTTRQPLGGAHRALGWETPTGSNSAGRQLSMSAYGHTGFTGTSLWIDPQQDLFILLLTNRVSPSRTRTGIGSVRIALAEAAVAALAATRSTASRPAASRP